MTTGRGERQHTCDMPLSMLHSDTRSPGGAAFSGRNDIWLDRSKYGTSWNGEIRTYDTIRYRNTPKSSGNTNSVVQKNKIIRKSIRIPRLKYADECARALRMHVKKVGLEVRPFQYLLTFLTLSGMIYSKQPSSEILLLKYIQDLIRFQPKEHLRWQQTRKTVGLWKVNIKYSKWNPLLQDI